MPGAIFIASFQCMHLRTAGPLPVFESPCATPATRHVSGSATASDHQQSSDDAHPTPPARNLAPRRILTLRAKMIEVATSLGHRRLNPPVLPIPL